MKWLLIILFPLCLHAQDTTHHRWLQSSVCALSSITGGLGDGLNSRTLYNPGHALVAVSYGSLLVLPFTGRVDWRMPLTYALLRYALFDLCYNVGAHRRWNYEGNKYFYDEGVGKMPGSVVSATKLVSLGIVFYLTVRR